MSRINPQVESLQRECSALRAQIDRMRADPGEMPMSGCGDNSCIVRRPQGMATNGGCRCDERTLRRAVMWHRARETYLTECVRMALAAFDEERGIRADVESRLWEMQRATDPERTPSEQAEQMKEEKR